MSMTLCVMLKGRNKDIEYIIQLYGDTHACNSLSHKANVTITNKNNA